MTTPSSMRGWAVAILAALTILLLAAIFLPLGEAFAGQSADAAAAQQALATYRAEIAARPRLEAERNAVDRQEASAAALVGGASTALAAASLQSLVKDLVEKHGGQLRSAQTLYGAPSGGLEKVEVQFEVSLPLGSLKAATYELETGSPYLFLDIVDIRPEIYSGGATGAPGDLHVQWTLHGYRRMGTP
jgi:general secretion pathway protein M